MKITKTNSHSFKGDINPTRWDIPTSHQVMFVGDVHNDWAAFTRKVKEHDITKTIFIVAGDVGVGFRDSGIEHLTKLLATTLGPHLTSRDNYLMLVRGNHDDPQFFKPSFIEKNPVHKRFIFVPDYTFINFEYEDIKTSSMVLCVGGGLSIDRCLRKEGKTYWSDELPVDIGSAEFISTVTELNIPFIDYVCTHGGGIVEAQMLSFGKGYSPLYDVKDPKLRSDTDKEFSIIQTIIDHVKDHNVELNPDRKWHHIHGHWHKQVSLADINDSRCHVIGLDCNEVKLLHHPLI